ncbi:hypothetical protein BCV70DRAFT_224476 [Testicularia cyperi]|uniref:SLC41A/MgtE integral membrane domain-containing protein n=1 Tax=Testicularia cyperi TaxID=1882483 RepID=A0A317XWW9_9BASI|nr:hypothetical protein BCV70DRAFT_224476 [Testicularia cyperi]
MYSSWPCASGNDAEQLVSSTTSPRPHRVTASALHQQSGPRNDIEAPHHTLIGEDDSEDDEAISSTSTATVAEVTTKGSGDRSSDIKVVDHIRTQDYGGAGDGDGDSDSDTASFLADTKKPSKHDPSHPDFDPSNNRGSIDDDEYETRASLIGAEGFVDRRGTALRRKPSGSIFARFWEIAREALPTLVVSLLSLVFSGELLVHLARWPVFQKVDKLFILIPILLNMKGNLEMNLSLRMSTSANIGELDVRRTRETLIRGNMALLQVQALIVSAFAGVLAFVLGIVTPDPMVESPSHPSQPPQESLPATPESIIVNSIVRSAFSALSMRQRRRRGLVSPASASTMSRLEPRRIIHHHPKPPVDPALRLRNGYFEFVLVIATGMLSASLSSAILGSFMCALVVVSRRLGANPDNIASPLAASLGDLTTLTLLGLLASALVHFEGTFLATLILAGLAAACIACFIVTYRNAYVRELLTSGWVPLLVAMFISSGAGLVLDNFVQKYEGFALLAPVISGLPGACAAIFASRITTALHSGKGASLLRSASKSANEPGLRGFLASIAAVLSIPPIEGWLVPLSLLTMGVTIKTVFIVLIRTSGQMTFGWVFAASFLMASATANMFALYLAHVICLVLWSRDYDPDIYCLPFVSSIVDVVGQSLLVLTFTIATSLGDHITAAVNAGAGHGGT